MVLCYKKRTSSLPQYAKGKSMAERRGPLIHGDPGCQDTFGCSSCAASRVLQQNAVQISVTHEPCNAGCPRASLDRPDGIWLRAKCSPRPVTNVQIPKSAKEAW